MTRRFENRPLLSYAAVYSASWQHHDRFHTFFFPFGFGILGCEMSTAFQQQNQSVYGDVSQLFIEDDGIFSFHIMNARPVLVFLNFWGAQESIPPAYVA